MKISAKMHYGLKTMIELAIHSGEGGILQKDLSERQCMPNKFMDAVIHELKVAGLIVNVSGKKSGYKLARNPAEITVYDVYRAFEPELRIHFCLVDRKICPRSCNCASRNFLSFFNQEMESVMQASTIENLMKNQEELNQQLIIN
jgi:Rrf2 family protein